MEKVRTHDRMEGEKPRLDPRPVAVESPNDGGEDEKGLESVLDDETGFVVVEPVSFERDSEEDRERRAGDQDGVCDGEGEGIPFE